ncbi:unnamed protein product [Prorocentrum cordatum]|uniref:Uncharacterized protein n=1 Tax=Prorocentrum cordatum TaxID=2364126 RepID=A0ABN9WVP9_9DINO|nr:unnamed protein product [Polarella glacialis]
MADYDSGAYIIDHMQKMMKIPFWSEDMGPNGSWMPLYVRVKTEGRYAGVFPTIAECKAELKRSVSFLTDPSLSGKFELYAVKMPDRGEMMPLHPQTDGDYPLGDEWIVNDRTALYIHMSMPDAGGDYEQKGEDYHEQKGDNNHSIATPMSDSSIKDWVAAKAAKKMTMTMADIEGLDIDEIYQMGYAAAMQKLAKKAVATEAAQESTLESVGSAASWHDVATK